MQAQKLSQGLAVDHTPASAVVAGQMVLVGTNLLGVAPVAIEANKLGVLDIAGIFDVVSANEQITAGALVYWDADGNPYGGTAGTGAATATSTSNTLIGVALATAGATAGKVRVLKYGPVAVTASTHEMTSAVIADPGNAGAIPVTGSGYCALESAGAETRTMAAPTFAGQQILLCAKTAVGAITVTIATHTTSAESGDTAYVMNTAGDMLLFIAIYNGANLRWRLVKNDTCAVS